MGKVIKLKNREFLMNRVSILKKVILSCWLIMVFGFLTVAREENTYQEPPREITVLVDSPKIPEVRINTGGNILMILEFPGLPSIAELSQPELRLAGIRINPKTNGPSLSQTYYYNQIIFKDLDKMLEIPVIGLPADSKISDVTWSPKGDKAAFLLTCPGGIELWVVNAADGKAVKLTDAINAVGCCSSYDRPWSSFEWCSDNQHILFRRILNDRGNPPTPAPVPKGPVVQDNTENLEKAPLWTYQDLLKNEYDEKMFSFYASSQLMAVDVESQQVISLGNPGIIQNFSTSPDGSYILVEIIDKPFSYLVPYDYFRHRVQVWDSKGKLVEEIADIPRSEDIPVGADAVIKGPREFDWRADAPAVLYWAEAQDDGDPGKEVDYRDKLFLLDAPFTGKPKEGPVLKYRYGNVRWSTGKMAMITIYWQKTRKRIIYRFKPDSPGEPLDLVFDLDSEDEYNDPGRFVLAANQFGRYVLITDKKKKFLYLRGDGASSNGDQPFLDQFEIKTRKTTRLWQSSLSDYEYVFEVIDIDKDKVLISREKAKIQPNYYLLDIKGKKWKQVTDFPHPYPSLKDLEKILIKYKRKDGVDLTGNLYLPLGYDKTKDGPLPIIIWAYPEEFKSKSNAGQVSGSPNQFTQMNWRSPAPWVTQGYAVLDRASMPIVGERDEEPNDTFIEQLVANANAAIDKLDEMGVGDRKRAAIEGHSYGAFMTANLLAHSCLFAAGIAGSGAYNRTLTPFGFQNEERTLWEAPETYIKMSPLMYAPKIKSPILLIHGDADDNPGTLTIQSIRLYQALKGYGAPARLVLLPNESHVYNARESILHVMWETYNWLEKYVKK